MRSDRLTPRWVPSAPYQRTMYHHRTSAIQPLGDQELAAWAAREGGVVVYRTASWCPCDADVDPNPSSFFFAMISDEDVRV